MIGLTRNPVGFIELHQACTSSNNLKQVMNRIIFLVVLLTSVNGFAETRVTPVNETMQVTGKECDVTVYQTPLSALKNGEIVEICTIEGTSSRMSKSSAEKVIRKNAHEACGCGTDKVYVMSQSELNGRSAHVVMVAFKYANEQVASLPAEVASLPAVISSKAVRRTNATYANSSKSRPANTRRVSVDDYESILRTVTRPQQREVLWLSQKSQSD